MATPSSVEPPPAGAGSAGTAFVPVRNPRVHLGFIDALRALAALYVMFGHAFAQLLPYQQALAELHPKQQKLLSFIYVALFRHGHESIVLFTVGLPFAVFGGYLLFRGVERHFIRTLPAHAR